LHVEGEFASKQLKKTINHKREEKREGEDDEKHVTKRKQEGTWSVERVICETPPRNVGRAIHNKNWGRQRIRDGAAKEEKMKQRHTSNR